jgi:arginine deiminase
LDCLLASDHLYSTADFPTINSNSPYTAIDKIFTDKYKNTKFSIKPLPNRLPDHDAQILTLQNTNIQNSMAHHYTKRLINEFNISDFKLNLSYESREVIFTESDVDIRLVFLTPI